MTSGLKIWGRSVMRLGAVGLATLALGGCWADKPFLVALPQIPQDYRASATGPAHPPGFWAAQFGSKELARLVELAQEQNLDIAAASARIVQAQGQAEIAGAGLYPQVQANENASRTLSPGTLRAKEGPFRSSISNRFDLGLTASYTLDLFGRNQALALSGQENALASVYDRDVVAVATLATVANSYFLMLAAQDRLRLAREDIRIAENVLEAIRERLEVGTATALDLAQQESVVANQRASVPALEQIVQQTRNVLAVLVGRTPESTNVRGGSLDTLRVPAVSAGLPSQLLFQRPDIASAETKLASQSANVAAARAAFLPTITLTGTAGVASQTLKNLLRPDALAASLAEGLVAPIFTGGNLEGQLLAAEGRQIEALEIYRKSIVQGLADVENALIGVQQSAIHEKLQLAAVAAARRAYQITEVRLREGTVDVVTLLNIQLTLFQAQDQLTQVRLQRFQAAVSLYQALGGGWTKERAALIFAGPAAGAGVAAP